MFLPKATQIEVTPASSILLPDDPKGSSGDEKSTMTTSAPSTKQKHAITSNQNNANHNNQAQNRPKSCAQTKFKQQGLLHTHQRSQVTSRSCSSPKLRKMRSLPHRVCCYLIIKKSQWRRKINNGNPRPKHKTKTCTHFKSK